VSAKRVKRPRTEPDAGRDDHRSALSLNAEFRDEQSRTRELSVTSAPQHALTDQMIERLAITSGNALELLDRLNEETTSEALHRLIDRLTEMERIGALDTAFDVVMLPHAMRNALTDVMIERLASYAEYLVTNLANEDVIDLVVRSSQAMNQAVEESKKAPAVGVRATISMLSKPETQRGILFLLKFTDKLQQRLSGVSTGETAIATKDQ
jgi:uncharacterized protein YjgD (DUF1641 family)